MWPFVSDPGRCSGDSDRPRRPEWITIGTVTAPHGVEGEVRVYPHTDRPERFASLRRVYLGASGRGTDPRQVESASVAPQRIVLKLSGVDGRDSAEALRGRDLLVPGDEAWPLPAGHYYHFQLVGLTVRDLAGRLRGQVSRVYPGPANDFYAVETALGRPETLIPAVRHVIKQVDLEHGLMVVDWPQEYEPPEQAGKGDPRAR